jgi:hypothetical protein
LEGYYQVPPKSPLSDILDYLTSYNPPGWDWQNKNGDLSQPVYAYKYTGFIDQAAICAFMYEDSHFGTFAAVDLFLLQHEHDINHQHDIDHTHGMDHTHDNSLVYGIYEGTYPNNVNIIINGQSFGVSYGDGSNPIDYMNLNITPFVHKGNNKIQITTSQNGWIDATVYSQIFIQSK